VKLFVVVNAEKKGKKIPNSSPARGKAWREKWSAVFVSQEIKKKRREEN